MRAISVARDLRNRVVGHIDAALHAAEAALHFGGIRPLDFVVDRGGRFPPLLSGRGSANYFCSAYTFTSRYINSRPSNNDFTGTYSLSP